MKGVIQEYQETQRTAEVSEKKQAFLQDFKEMITEAIKALKSDTEWAELGDYYLALTFLFDMVDTELSSEFNITIGNQMLVAYPSKLGHILDDTPPLLDYSAGSGEFIKYKGAFLLLGRDFTGGANSSYEENDGFFEGETRNGAALYPQ